MNSELELSIVVPCYNEEANLPELSARLTAALERERVRGEVILVDDGSTDQTAAVIRRISGAEVGGRGVWLKRNSGIEGAWRAGLEAAHGEFACFIDADLQYLPEDVPRLYRVLLSSRSDLVQGVRSSIGRLKDGRYVLSKGLNAILNTLFGMSAVDNKSGFVVARSDVLKQILIHRFRYFYFQTFIGVSANAKGYSIEERETLFESRYAGQSFIGSFPLLLIFKCLLDLGKAFVEFRILRNRQEPDRESTLLKLYYLLFPLHKWMITRRVRVDVRELCRSQWFSPAQLRELQEEKLRKLVQHCYAHVDYYRRVFDEHGIDPRTVCTLDDLRRLPLLSKDDVRQHLHSGLLSDNHDKRRILKILTSGSTGEPFLCYVDRRQLEMRWAATFRSMLWTGYRFGDRQMRLWHQTIGMTRTQVYREKIDAWLSRRMFIPAFEMSRDRLPEIIEKIDRYQPALIDGYAESFHLLARYISESGVKLTCRPKGIISSAQKLDPLSRGRIEAAFGCKVFDKYGSREFSGIAYECEANDGHHVVEECYAVEILRQGRPVGPGEVGEVVITDLNNYCLPLLRYRIGDLAVAMDNTQPCRCGRGLARIGSVEGRVQAIIVCADGKLLPGTFFSHFFKDYDYLIRQYQVVQERENHFFLRIVKGGRFNDPEFSDLIIKLRKFVGDTEIEVQFVPHIAMVSTGKYQASISKLPVEFQNIESQRLAWGWR